MPDTVRSGVVAPLLIDNINTDVIIRSRDISPDPTDDLGRHLFACWRERPGEPFVLDRAEYAGATILLTGANFGCGSSREAAVWALRDAGFAAVIAPSFGAIFASNCVQNRIVPVVLPATAVAEIAGLVATAAPALELAVDIEALAVHVPGGRSFPFVLEPLPQALLGTGRSAFDLLRDHTATTAAFEAGDRERRPWAYLR